jgi:hypothetical protein
MFKYFSIIRRALEFQRNNAPDTPEHRRYWNSIIGALDILVARYYREGDV